MNTSNSRFGLCSCDIFMIPVSYSCKILENLNPKPVADHIQVTAVVVLLRECKLLDGVLEGRLPWRGLWRWTVGCGAGFCLSL